MAATKLTAKKIERYLRLLTEGQRRTGAAKAIGMTRQAIWKAKRDDPEFASQCDEAELAANQVVEDAVFKAAAAGSFAQQAFWLTNRDPDHWRDARQINLQVQKLSDDDLITYVARSLAGDAPPGPDLARLAGGGNGTVAVGDDR